MEEGSDESILPTFPTPWYRFRFAVRPPFLVTNRALTERGAGHSFNKRQQLSWPMAEETR